MTEMFPKLRLAHPEYPEYEISQADKDVSKLLTPDPHLVPAPQEKGGGGQYPISRLGEGSLIHSSNKSCTWLPKEGIFQLKSDQFSGEFVISSNVCWTSKPIAPKGSCASFGTQLSILFADLCALFCLTPMNASPCSIRVD